MAHCYHCGSLLSRQTSRGCASPDPPNNSIQTKNCCFCTGGTNPGNCPGIGFGTQSSNHGNSWPGGPLKKCSCCFSFRHTDESTEHIGEGHAWRTLPVPDEEHKYKTLGKTLPESSDEIVRCSVKIVVAVRLLVYYITTIQEIIIGGRVGFRCVGWVKYAFETQHDISKSRLPSLATRNRIIVTYTMSLHCRLAECALVFKSARNRHTHTHIQKYIYTTYALHWSWAWARGCSLGSCKHILFRLHMNTDVHMCTSSAICKELDTLLSHIN